MDLINGFKEIFLYNKVASLNTSLTTILSELFNRASTVDYFSEFQINGSNSHLIVKLILDLIEQSKVHHKGNEALISALKKYIFDPSINRFFTIKNRVELFVMLELSEEYSDFLKEEKLDS